MPLTATFLILALPLVASSWRSDASRTAQCPEPASTALSAVIGSWSVTAVSSRDQGPPDSTTATATITPDLDDCLLIERYTGLGGGHALTMFAVWGSNGRNGDFQRLLTHSGHGLLGLFQGPRRAGTLFLRLIDPGNPPSVLIEHVVAFLGPRHFSITSRRSDDGGQHWTTLTVWDYRPASPRRST